MDLLRRIEAMVKEIKEKQSRDSLATQELRTLRAAAARRKARQRLQSRDGHAPGPRDSHGTEGTTGEKLFSSSPVKQGQEIPPVVPPSRPGHVTQIFEHWRSTWNKSKAELTADRRKKIQTRLTDGYAVERLCDAISGSKLDTWEGRKDNCDVSQLMKPANIDKFAEMWAKRQMNGNAPLWQKQGFTSPEEYAKHLAALPSEGT